MDVEVQVYPPPALTQSLLAIKKQRPVKPSPNCPNSKGNTPRLLQQAFVVAALCFCVDKPRHIVGQERCTPVALKNCGPGKRHAFSIPLGAVCLVLNVPAMPKGPPLQLPHLHFDDPWVGQARLTDLRNICHAELWAAPLENTRGTSCP